MNLHNILYFRVFVDPTRNVNCKGKQNSENIQRVKNKTPFESKLHKSDYQQQSFVL